MAFGQKSCKVPIMRAIKLGSWRLGILVLVCGCNGIAVRDAGTGTEAASGGALGGAAAATSTTSGGVRVVGSTGRTIGADLGGSSGSSLVVVAATGGAGGNASTGQYMTGQGGSFVVSSSDRTTVHGGSSSIVSGSGVTGGTTSMPIQVGTPIGVVYAAKRPGGVMLGNCTGHLLALDKQDNLIAVGPRTAHDLSQPDPGPALLKLSPSGQELQLKEYPDAVMPEVLAVDSTGAVIMAGQLYRTVSFGVSTLQAVQNGFYLAKIDSSGNEVWAKAVTRPDTFWLRGITVDVAGNIYVGGSQDDMSAGWLEHAYVARYSADGTENWHQQFSNTNSTANAHGLAFLSSGALVVAGAFNGTMQVGPTVLKTTATSLGYESYNGWFTQLAAATGSPSGTQRFGGTLFDLANAVGVTRSDGIRLAGTLSGASIVAGVSAEANIDGSPFVADVNASGQGQWVRLLGNLGSVFSAATGYKDRTVAVGRFDTDEWIASGNVDNSSAFVSIVENDGTVSQQSTYPTRSNGASAVVTDSHGGVWVSGEFIGTVAFGTKTLQSTDYQLFLVKLNPTP